MRLSPVGVSRAATAARALARVATGAAATDLAVSLYSILVGGFRLHLGPIRLSSAGWWSPFTQAVWFGSGAAWLFYQDASLRGSWDRIPRAVRRFLSGPEIEVTRRLSWTAVLVGSVASLLLCFRIAHRSIVVGSHEGGWIYDYLQPFSLWPIAVALLVSGVVALGLVLSGRALRRHEWLVVFSWVFLAIGLQAALRSLTPFSFEQIFGSGVANSFYSVTQQFDARTALTGFTSLRDAWPIHAHSNMPGKLMLVYALELISTRPDVLSWLVVLVSNLGGVLLYIFVRDLFADRQVALFSLVLYFFVPGKIFFFPLMNVVTPVIVCACALLVLRWLRTGRAAYAAASGVALFGLAFFEPVPLVMGLLFAALAARAVSRGDLTARRFLLQGCVLVGAFIVTYVAMYLAFGFDLVDALRRVLADAASFNVKAGRPYSIWIRRNLFDFPLSAGVCQVVIFGAVLLGSVRRRGRMAGLVARPIAVLSAALAAVLLVTDLAGVGRGEIIRLWIFLACFVQIPTAYVCARLNSRLAIALVLTITIVQGALGTSMIGFIIP
jgi:hypothetical protein